MTMQVRLTKIDGKFMLPLTDEMIRTLGINENEEMNISFEESEKKIILTSQNEDELFEKLTKEMFEERRSMFEALAEGAK